MRLATGNLAVLLVFQTLSFTEEKKFVKVVIEKMSFLISVDHGPFRGCKATIRTPMLVPATSVNNTKSMNISTCDHGKLVFNVRYPRYPPDPKVASVVDVSFTSFNVDNPPTCSIPWNVTYRFPTGQSYSSLPGCFTKVVQPAFDFYLEHAYYFKIYDWKGHLESFDDGA
ncbi:uncharacterized protein LOC133184016 [Saccostrea echinata]|uniref:uncharacterized protein LOC133184016 n=1 Tax=Saccostrea echinata TaxID=191078 RepID=UPI002A82402B|nr:uncharacterized protein LOC133184016 [Saccostrea echinata]